MPKHKSEVWKHFTKRTINNKIHAVCKYCQSTYLSNATRMLAHLKKCQPSTDSVPQETSSANCKVVSGRETPTPGTSGMASMVELSHGVAADRNKMSLGASFVDRMSKKEQTDLQESFARAVYASGTPFSIVENSHWTNKILQHWITEQKVYVNVNLFKLQELWKNILHYFLWIESDPKMILK